MAGSDRIYDLIIISASPAGITTAIYAVRKKMDFLVLTTNNYWLEAALQLMKITSKVYLGVPIRYLSRKRC